MNIIISVQQPDINSLVDERFGRAAWFLQVDTETNNWQTLPNPGGANRGGAGVAAAQLAVDQHAGAVISGDFGPNAVAALEAAGIQMYCFPKGGLIGSDVVALFQKGALSGK